MTWAKALEAARAARLLEEWGSTNGATSRSYFAMFHAVRVALGNIAPELRRTKQHRQVIGRFSKHAVRERGVDRSHGRAFNVIYEKRLKADYSVDDVGHAEARRIVDQAHAFLDAIKAAKLDSPK